MQAYFANLQGDYRSAAATAAEGAPLAEQAGDSFTHELCQYQQSWALLHAGEWGGLLRTLDAALRLAERNEHRMWTSTFRLLLAWWATYAGVVDFAAARAAECLSAALAAEHEYGTVLALLVSGWAELGRGASAAAQSQFAAVLERTARHPAAMEWVLHLPLRLGLSTAALLDGDAPRASEHAVAVCDLAAQSRERTYLALGHRAIAAAALTERRWDDAEAALDAARAALDGGPAPLAEWQIWSTAAALAGARGRRKEAAQHRARSAAVLDQLAASLQNVDFTTAGALGLPIEDVQRAIRAQAQEP
jgi:hypothetical protein